MPNPYTFDITATANDTVDTKALHAQIAVWNSDGDPMNGIPNTIDKALKGVTYDAGTTTITVEFSGDLSAGGETKLNEVVAGHDGLPLPAAQTQTFNSTGALRVQADPREGDVLEDFSIDWSDRTTWWPEATNVTGETPTEPDASTLQLAHSPVVDVTHGKITQEHRLEGTYAPKVYVDGVLQPEREFAYDAAVTSADGRTMEAGTWSMDYDTGLITKLAGFPAGAVTVDYYYAGSSAWPIVPSAGKTLDLLAVEVQFDTASRQKDTVIFQTQIMAVVAALGGLIPPSALMSNGGTVLDTDYIDFPVPTTDPNPANWSKDVAQTRCYKSIQDFWNESQRNYPEMPRVGGGDSDVRGTPCSQYILRWPYQEQAKRVIADGTKTRIRIFLKYDQPFEGKKACLSVYSVEET